MQNGTLVAKRFGRFQERTLAIKQNARSDVFDAYGETEMLAVPLIPVASKMAPEIV